MSKRKTAMSNTTTQTPSDAPAPAPAPAAPAAPAQPPSVASTVAATPAKPVAKAAVVKAPVVTLEQVNKDLETATVNPTEKATSVYGTFQEAIDKLDADGRIRFQRLAEYIEAMKPGRPIDEITGAAWQRVLFNIISGIINKSPAFNEVFGLFIQVVKLHRKGVFSDTHLGRFVAAIVGSKEEAKAFVRFINLVTVIADNDGGAGALRQVSLAHSLQFCVTPEGKERIRDWLGVAS